MIAIIAAISSNGVIGQDNKIPFHYSEDFKYFKKRTLDNTVIMGRSTFESIGKPLPDRRNIVITSSTIDNVITYKSVREAILMEREILDKKSPFKKETWVIGGARIYQEALDIGIDKLVLTVTPDYIEGDNTIKFPWINPKKYEVTKHFVLSKEKDLNVFIYKSTSENFSSRKENVKYSLDKSWVEAQ